MKQFIKRLFKREKKGCLQGKTFEEKCEFFRAFCKLYFCLQAESRLSESARKNIKALKELALKSEFGPIALIGQPFESLNHRNI
jgi:hypothetical protein